MNEITRNGMAQRSKEIIKKYNTDYAVGIFEMAIEQIFKKANK